ncbi:uncharacterized protein LOC122553115 isoform X1 [Chiloscyllium plagiosum]|uniref:uncharacterized protein LOC122553115 isoform X1 n=1 Tax=Chiloscyllium plagiosum TaxID=36176 RepID=UPI001CB824A1|nr:uncharacterized protein LOC122553115 isoform X1 [Chiloscyllium plagiosum]
MDDCNLKELSLSAGMLDPAFNPSILNYRVTLGNDTVNLTIYPVTSDNHATYQIIGTGGSKTVGLQDGLNKIEIEVAAEDGTLKRYKIEATKLSANTPVLSGLKIAENLTLDPPFSISEYKYTCTAPLNMISVIVEPIAPDHNMHVTVNGSEVGNQTYLNVGHTKVEVNVTSADGTNSQIYQIVISRVQFPWSITFSDLNDVQEYECPISLKAYYRPVSIKGSDPKHIFSSSLIKFLTRKTKCNPFDDTPFDGQWCVPEYEVDKRMSAASVYCCFRYRGCTGTFELSELGKHALECPFKPPSELDSKVSYLRKLNKLLIVFALSVSNVNLQLLYISLTIYGES